MGIAEKIISGDIRSVARLIRDIDDNVPGAREVLKDLYPFTGRAYVVGITGAPGVGKSTLVDQMVTHLRSCRKDRWCPCSRSNQPFQRWRYIGRQGQDAASQHG